MAGQNLNLVMKVLREAGVNFSCPPESLTSIIEVARKYKLVLDADDEAALEALEIDLGASRPVNPAFNPAINFHPELFVPARRAGKVVNESGESKPLPQAAVLHPWGRIDERLEAGMKAHVPIDWRETDWAPKTAPPPADTRAWEIWVEGITKAISTTLWPRFDRKHPNCWDTAEVADLLEADFTVLSVLHENLELPIEGRYPSQVMHSSLFVEEDDGITPFGSTYTKYDPELTDVFYSEMPRIFAGGMADKVGTLDLQLKKRFQRPRAHQVAFLQNRHDFSYRWARTGNTPSMVSGHCLQSSIGGATGWVTLKGKLGKADGASDIYRQFVVDVGDRRVFAGVHYPSDNLASWYVAMRLIPRVFLDSEKEAEPRTFLWSAIKEKSLVYQAIALHANKKKGKESPYVSMLKMIEGLVGEGG